MYGIPADHRKLAELLNDKATVILYPIANAQSLTDFVKRHRHPNEMDSAANETNVHLVLIDSTWKTSKKLIRAMRSNAAISSKLQFVSLLRADEAVFDKLRKQTREDGYS